MVLSACIAWVNRERDLLSSSRLPRPVAPRAVAGAYSRPRGHWKATVPRLHRPGPVLLLAAVEDRAPAEMENLQKLALVSKVGRAGREGVCMESAGELCRFHAVAWGLCVALGAPVHVGPSCGWGQVHVCRRLRVRASHVPAAPASV